MKKIMSVLLFAALPFCAMAVEPTTQLEKMGAIKAKVETKESVKAAPKAKAVVAKHAKKKSHVTKKHAKKKVSKVSVAGSKK